MTGTDEFRILGPMKILTIGHPVLTQRAEPVRNIDGRLAGIVERMADLMRRRNGLGLAATQVGILHRFFLMRLEEDQPPLVLINPEIVSESAARVTAEEGCLSVPGIYGPVERARRVTVRYLDLDGNERTMKLSDLAARVVQHEYDHLEGRLFLDRMAPERLAELKRRLEEAERAQAGR